MEDIRENNILIAEFMGWKKALGLFDIPVIRSPGLVTQHDLEKAEHLGYHDNWMRLHKVIDKIEAIEKDKQLLFEVVISGAECGISSHDSIDMPEIAFVEKTKIEAVYYTCVEFIKWWNLRNI